MSFQGTTMYPEDDENPEDDGNKRNSQDSGSYLNSNRNGPRLSIETYTMHTVHLH
jgi:hypothetical protein